MKKELRKAYIAGMKKAFELSSKKMGINFGNSGKDKEAAFKKWFKENE